VKGRGVGFSMSLRSSQRIFNLALFNPYPINKYNTFDQSMPNFILTIKFVQGEIRHL
jgi:hypothetical protein